MTAIEHRTSAPNGTGTWSWGIEGAPQILFMSSDGTFLINGSPIAGVGAVLLAPGNAGQVAVFPAAGQWLTGQQPYSAGDANPDTIVFYSTNVSGTQIKGWWLNGNVEPRSAPSTLTRRGWVAYEYAASLGGGSTSVFAAFSTNPVDPATRENLLGGYGTAHSTQPGWIVATRVMLAQQGAGFGGTFGTLSQGILRGRSASRGAPTAGTYSTGDSVQDVNGAWFLCTAGGTPGTWAVGAETPSDPGIVFPTHSATGAVPLLLSRTPWGNLELSGGITLDTTGIASGGTLLTLPIGYRPSVARVVTIRSAGGAAAAALFTFNTDGTVICSANLSGASPTTVSFDSIRIRL